MLPRIVGLAAVLLAGCGIAFDAQAGTFAGTGAQSALSVTLTCSIKQGKIIVIQNKTGSDLAGGTLTFDYVRRSNGAHVPNTYTNVSIANGATLQKGIDPAVSCTASYQKQLLMAPSP